MCVRRYCIVVIMVVMGVLNSQGANVKAEDIGLDYGGKNQCYGKVPGTYISKHVKWLYPLQKKIKVLIVIPQQGARDIVEMSERMDIEYKYLMTGTPRELVAPENFLRQAMNAIYGGLLPNGEEVIKRLATEVLYPTNVYDLIVIGGVQWKVLPDFVRKNIVKRVEEGTKLLIIGLSEELKDCYDDANTNEFKEELTRGIPYKFIPLRIADTYEDIEKEHRALRIEWGDKGVYIPATGLVNAAWPRAGRRGKGRVVCLQYRSSHYGGIVPGQIAYHPIYYEYYWCMVLRACKWLLREEIEAVRLGVKVPEGKERETKRIEISVDRENYKGAGVYLEYAIKNAGDFKRKWTNVEVFRNREYVKLLEDKASSLAIDIPPLPEGENMLEIRAISDGGKVLDYYIKCIKVEANRNIEIKMDRKVCSEGDKIRGTYKVIGGLKQGEKVITEVIDTYERLVYRRESEEAEGNIEVEVKGVLSQIYDVVVKIEDRDGEVTKNIEDVRIYTSPTIKKRYGNFLFSTLTGDYLAYAFPYIGITVENMKSYGVNAARGRAGACEWAVRNNLLLESTYLDPPSMFQVRGAKSTQTKAGVVHSHCIHKLDKTKWKERIEKALGPVRGIYTFGVAAALEGYANIVCHCDVCQGMFRDYAKESYKSIDELNGSWNTDYRDWGEIKIHNLKDAFKGGHQRQWIDYEIWFKKEIAEAYGEAMEEIHGYLPNATAYTVDWPLISTYDGLPSLDWPSGLRTIRSHYSDETPTSFVNKYVIPEMLKGLPDKKNRQLGIFGDMGYHHNILEWKMKISPWLLLLYGGNIIQMPHLHARPLRAGGLSAFTADRSEAMGYLEEISKQIKKIQEGIGSLLLSSERIVSPILFVLSTPSAYASTIFAEDEVSYESAIKDFIAGFKAMGYTLGFEGEDYLTDELLRNYKVVVLPYNRAMPDITIEVLKRYVKKGGVLAADNKPAIYNEHCVERQVPGLKDIFPDGDELKVKKYGKGYGISLGGEMAGMLRKFHNGDTGFLIRMGHLLKEYASLEPLSRVLDKTGRDRYDSTIVNYRAGTSRFTGIVRAHYATDKGRESEVRLDKEGYNYDMISGAYLGHGSRIRMVIEKDEPVMIATFAEKIRGIEARITPEVSPGRSVGIGIRIELSGRDKDIVHGIRVKVYNSNREELGYYTLNHIFRGDRYIFELPVALNMGEGVYTVKIKHIPTGLETVGTFRVIM